MEKKLLKTSFQALSLLWICVLTTVGCSDDGTPDFSRGSGDTGLPQPLVDRPVFRKESAVILNAEIKPQLSVDESIGLACIRATQSTEFGIRHLCKAVNPAAISEICTVLQDDSSSVHWAAAADALAYVGGDAEARLLLSTLLRRVANNEKDKHSIEYYSSSLRSLGIMARRNVGEAKFLFPSTCDVDYWKDVREVYGDEKIELRRMAIYADAVARWGCNHDLYAMLRENGDEIAGYINEHEIENMLGAMTQSERKDVSDLDHEVLQHAYEVISRGEP